MNESTLLAKHFRDVHFGGNWTDSNVQEQLSEVSLEDALYRIEGFNTIAQLAYHIHYFVHVVRGVLKGGPLVGKDAESFDHPAFASEAEWAEFKSSMLQEANEVAELIELLPTDRLFEDFTDPKYGTYYRNLHGIIEHTHYHLGQIALIKKWIHPSHTPKPDDKSV